MMTHCDKKDEQLACIHADKVMAEDIIYYFKCLDT